MTVICEFVRGISSPTHDGSSANLAHSPSPELVKNRGLCRKISFNLRAGAIFFWLTSPAARVVIQDILNGFLAVTVLRGPVWEHDLEPASPQYSPLLLHRPHRFLCCQLQGLLNVHE